MLPESEESSIGLLESDTSMMSADKRKDTPFSSISVYRRIESDLRARIAQGQWPLGVMLPSRKNLAREYGVDERTLQRAIASLLADGTLRADGGRGTFVTEKSAVPGLSVPSARAALTKMVAVILDQSPPPTYPSAQAVLQAVHRTFHAQASDYRIVMFGIYGDTAEQRMQLERHALDVIETEGIAGAIFCQSGDPETLPQIARMVENGIPIVFLDRYPPEMACDYVGVDNVHSAREAVDYLLSLGHRRIAHLTTNEPISTVSQRLTGYEQALTAAGLEAAPELIWKMGYGECLRGLRFQDELRNALNYFRGLAEPPTALFALNDHIAQSFIAESEAQGWNVPAQLSVIGFDDIEQFSPRPAFLTTIQQPFELTGVRAAELLLRSLELPKDRKRAFQHILLPTKLVVRSSCRPL